MEGAASSIGVLFFGGPIPQLQGQVPSGFLRDGAPQAVEGRLRMQLSSPSYPLVIYFTQSL